MGHPFKKVQSQAAFDLLIMFLVLSYSYSLISRHYIAPAIPLTAMARSLDCVPVGVFPKTERVFTAAGGDGPWCVRRLYPYDRVVCVEEP